MFPLLDLFISVFLFINLKLSFLFSVLLHSDDILILQSIEELLSFVAFNDFDDNHRDIDEYDQKYACLE